MVRQIISIEHVFYRYPGQDPYVLKDISLSINEGEWLAIVGHNGSGKSTLAKMLNGLHYPEKGEVRIDTFPLTEETVWEIRKQIGMVFQNPDNQFVGTTVQDDVAFGLENNGVPQNIMVERVNHALERVNMHSFLDQEPHHLSGGQKQRVAIAGVIALQPKVIILDEATSMLDPKGRKEVLETIFELKEELGLTVISITHDLEEASKADRIVVLNKGEVYNEGTPMEIFQMQEELIELGLDIPFSIKMGKELEKQGFTLEKNYLTENELVDALWTLHLNK
ncbi:energy-coupling factor ABC transporter ATP-binding protein [Heyndrickxia sp. FSL K6-6286]|jgi:energy-coupling factor transport system ATP-binding protein|uniref:energy-coupling factor ABC transporter ATP-binding protein n=1 Tax=Heyndrickxia sp. FSL K6-6286 TaxID=2921510 RepID=UPI0007172E6A|nr:energy-coupling factor ABC transporter ATP-binding protein [Heyndrickxia oleronia]OJH18610.1 energy-coupling factor transporter ATPase [Bacillus obstructivus]